MIVTLSKRHFLFTFRAFASVVLFYPDKIIFKLILIQNVHQYDFFGGSPRSQTAAYLKTISKPILKGQVPKTFLPVALRPIQKVGLYFKQLYSSTTNYSL